MINGNVNDFLDGIYNLQEMVHLYNGKKYFIQGYSNPENKDGYVLELQIWEPEEKILWKCARKDLMDLREAYLKEPLYEGKTFWEIEKEIEWVDS